MILRYVAVSTGSIRIIQEAPYKHPSPTLSCKANGCCEGVTPGRPAVLDSRDVGLLPFGCRAGLAVQLILRDSRGRSTFTSREKLSTPAAQACLSLERDKDLRLSTAAEDLRKLGDSARLRKQAAKLETAAAGVDMIMAAVMDCRKLALLAKEGTLYLQNEVAVWLRLPYQVTLAHSPRKDSSYKNRRHSLDVDARPYAKMQRS